MQTRSRAVPGASRAWLVGGSACCAARFPPGVGHEPHYHPPHFGYVLEGDSMRITTEEGVADRPVRAGGSVANDAEVRHQALHVGGETTRYLIVEKKYGDERPAGAVASGLCGLS